MLELLIKYLLVMVNAYIITLLRNPLTRVTLSIFDRESHIAVT